MVGSEANKSETLAHASKDICKCEWAVAKWKQGKENSKSTEWLAPTSAEQWNAVQEKERNKQTTVLATNTHHNNKVNIATIITNKQYTTFAYYTTSTRHSVATPPTLATTQANDTSSNERICF